MASIRMVGLSKRFGSLEVIPPLDLEIPDHEFAVFVGPSGCGKSTLLRIVAGLEQASGGDLFIGDRRVNALPPAARDIAMVFQDYALYPHMTVRQNMSFGLEMRGVPKAEIAMRVERAARMLHLEPFLDRRPRALSGGQRQRVAMGRAVVRDPAVFLFDEPLSNLDAKLRMEVRAEIKALSQALRTTTIFVTHDQVEAMTMADRLVVLEAGRIRQVGTPEEVYERPASRFVGGFIGSPSMNFLPAGIEGGDAVLADGSRLALPHGAWRNNDRIVLGIRPEDFQPAPPGGPGVPAAVRLVEPLGSDTLVHVVVAGVPCVARVAPSLRPHVEDRMVLSVLPARIHLFDPDTGDALRWHG